MNASKPRPALPDSMDLTGWNVMRAGNNTPLGAVASLKDAREKVSQ